MEQEYIELQGTIEDVVYHNSENGFSVIELSTDDEYITVVGSFSDISVGEELKLRGNWVVHHTFGRQFKAELYERNMPSTAADLYKYLASGAVTGIGPKTAQKIIERFGEDSFDVLENYPEKLTVIKGISLSKAEKMSKSFNEQFALRQILISLERFGMKSSECLKAYRAFGVNAAEVIKLNPYELCNAPVNMGFERAEAIAESLPVQPDEIYKIKAGIIHVIKHNLNNGHTCLPKRKIILPCCSLLNVDEYTIKDSISALIEDRRIISRVINSEEFLFLPDIYLAELNCADKIKMILRFPPAGKQTLLQDIEKIERKECIVYDQKQREAIITAVEKGMLILTGGPGTGKTTTLNGIIKIFQAQGLNVVLAAPTGRAAKRMSEVSGMDAKTIHRLLEVEWDKNDQPTFARNIRNPISADVLIVDELSMVDVVLFANLLYALPLGCRLILVGDSNQLPAVGAGNVLHDLINSQRLPVVELNKVFRQAMKSKIVTNAHDIVNGIIPDLNCKDNDFFFMRRNSSEAVLKTIVELVSERLPKAYNYTPMSDIQILTPTRKGDVGSVNLNKVIQDVLNPKSNKKNEITANGRIFRENDKVMQIKNNYDIIWVRNNEEGSGVFNGDIGTVKSIDRISNTLRIVFDDDKEALYPFENLQEIEHAYAMTVHKSQGNEFNAVIMPVFSLTPNLCYRNLLYTAVTRAKKLMILVGNDRVVEEMTLNDSKTKRYSALKEFLCSEYNDED